MFDNYDIVIDSLNRAKNLRDKSKEACVYLRQLKLDANGNLDSLDNIYEKAKLYESENDDLAAIVATNQAGWELANGRVLDLLLDADKAVYIFYCFEPAVLLAGIDNE